MTKTENYNLNQWEKTDRVLMDDFNEDNQKIDAALSNIPRVAFGSYTGKGGTSYNFQKDFAVGFTPCAVLIMTANGTTGDSNPFGGIFCPDIPLQGNNYTADVALIIENGFRIQGQYHSLYNSGKEYYWFAIG